MKIKTPLLPSLGLALLASAALQLHAQTWDTVSAIPNAVCGDVGADASGNVFAVGRHESADGSVAIVQAASGNPGSTWELLDAYSEVGRSYSYHRAVAANPGVPGHLFAGGNLNNILPDGSAEFDTLWIIRERNPVTGTWSTAEDDLDLANDVGQSSCADILVTPTGDVYATGGGQLGTGLGWLVRKRPVGASAFTTADVDYSGQSAGSGLDMAFHPDLGVIVVGYVNNVWTVRHSTTATGTLGSWQTLDAFQTQNRRGWEWTSSTANGVAVSQSTNIFVAGSAWNAGTGKYHWVVRHSTDRGATWAISDNVVPIGGRAEAFGIDHDAQGRIYVCGRSDKGDGYHWIVRRGQQVQKTTTVKGKKVTTLVWEWTQIDEYRLVTGKNSRANAITVDANGNIFVGGSGLDADDVQRFVVRRLAAQ